MITKENFCEKFPLIDSKDKSRDFKYSLSNLYQYLLTDVDYDRVSLRIDDILNTVNEECLLIDNILMRLGLDVHNIQKIGVTTKKVIDVKIGDIIPTNRTCSMTNLPIFFTITKIEKRDNDEIMFMGENDFLSIYYNYQYCIVAK